jgi:hypothetical protein
MFVFKIWITSNRINGSVFIPVDFGFHCGNKKSASKYGLSAQQWKKIESTIQDRKTYTYKQYRKFNKKKQTYYLLSLYI